MEYHRIATLTIIAASVLFAIVLYPIAPDVIPTHWNFAGEPDAWSDKAFGIFIIPIILIVSAIIFTGVLSYGRRMNTDPRGVSGWFVAAVLAVILAIQIYAGLAAVGSEPPAGLFFPLLFASLYYIISLLLPRISSRNRMIGIRTPWTMKSSEVWGQTHLEGARVFRIAAGFTLLGALFPDLLFLFIIGPVIGAALWLVFYSYRVYRDLGEIP